MIAIVSRATVASYVTGGSLGLTEQGDGKQRLANVEK